MPALFNRQIAITVETRRITGLRCAFKVVQSAKPEPNTSEVSIYNLSADARAELQATRTIATTIEAGYGKALGLLFSGELRRAVSTKQGADWITTLTAGDGAKALAAARVNESFRPGTPIKTVAKRLAQRLGVDLGDALSRIDGATMRAALTEYVNGKVITGPAKDAFDDAMKELGLEWSVQDGALQVLPRGEATNAQAVLLTPRTGLVGSPEAGEKGILKFRSLLQPSIRPGRKVKVESGQINGFYRVERVTHTGDTHANPWHSEIEGLPL